jgi:hypothetical protein
MVVMGVNWEVPMPFGEIGIKEIGLCACGCGQSANERVCVVLNAREYYFFDIVHQARWQNQERLECAEKAVRKARRYW